MSGTVDLERRLASWLEQDGPAAVPVPVVEAALAQARAVRQRPAWLTRTWWDRRPLVAAPAPADTAEIEPGERTPTSPVVRSPLRLAWVAVLLAALLIALIGGMLLVGSQLQRRLPAVVPPVSPTFAPFPAPTATTVPVGQVFECPPGSKPDEPGPVDQARPIVPSDAGAMAFDRRAGRLMALATGAAGVETWTFDVCTNTWTRMHPDREPSSVGSWPLVYDVDSDATILVADDRVWVYDLQDDTWTERTAAPPGATPWAYDPRSGLVVAGNYDAPEDLWNYDVETDTWAPIHHANPDGADPPYVVYDTSVDRFVGLGDGTWLFDARTGTWSRSSAEQPEVIAGFGWQAPTIAYDERAERTVVFGNDRLALYDATADHWEILDRDAGWPEPAVLSMTYDPANERLVGCAWIWPDGEVGVFALDLATREWTVLLEASGRPSSTPTPTPAP